jgi:acetate kinase
MVEPRILVINCGSSSLRFAIVAPESGEIARHGLAERLGTEGAFLRCDDEAAEALGGARDHGAALDRVLERLPGLGVTAVGHRVVHGGEGFSSSVVLDEASIRRIADGSALAPLHNPANLRGIAAARERFPAVPHVAVFDTAFHQSLPPKAYLYAVPYELYERYRVRRYGFHGSSHRYVASEAARLLGKPLAELELVTAHLGNGCSACAISGGRSVDTSMGLTPLEGLVMGTRSGDVDPSLHEFLVEHAGLSLSEVMQLLNRKSGLLGLSGSSSDMRTLLEARARSDERAALAIDVFCYRLAKCVLALCAGLSRLDALVFTGGIGEHASSIRAETLGALSVLGARVHAERNEAHGAGSGGRITADDSGLSALVVPTHEELVIARETAELTWAGSTVARIT